MTINRWLHSARLFFTHLDPILAQFQPDWVLVVGDTTTVVTTSQLAYYRRIKLGHVEAGLRTHNKWHPFPEELNRRIATVIADLHFAPTEWSRELITRALMKKTSWSRATLSLTHCTSLTARAATDYGTA